MRTLILAGASAVALVLGGGLGLAAGNSSHGANNQNGGSGSSSATQNPQGAGGSAQAGTSASRNAVMQAQQKLQSEGLYQGKVDGIEGPQTRQALKQFQQKNELQQTGQLDEQTQAKLGMTESNEQYGSSTPPSGTTGNGMNPAEPTTGRPNAGGSGAGQR